MCLISNDANVSLYNSIFPMCANSTKGMALAAGIKMLCKFCGCENSIITMNMLDANVIARGKGFKSLF